MEFPIRKLLKHRDCFEPLIWWENLFGKAAPAIRPFLSPCEDRRGEFFPSPDDPTVQLVIVDEGTRYRAIPPDHLKNKVDDVLLDWEDVQAYYLDCDSLRTSLRETLELKPAASHPVEGLFYIGRCARFGSLRHVYACLAVTDHEALRTAEACTDPKKIGCILFPAPHAKAFDLLRGRGIASVSLRECLSIKSTGFHGKCPGTCTSTGTCTSIGTCTSTGTCTGSLLPSGDTLKLESRLDTIEKTVLPDARRGSKTKNAASKGGKARAELYQPKIEEARQFIQKYHLENRSMCFTQALRKAAQHLHLSERTLKTHVKKGDFADW